MSFIENCKLGKKNIVSDFMSKQRGNLPLKNLAKCIFWRGCCCWTSWKLIIFTKINSFFCLSSSIKYYSNLTYFDQEIFFNRVIFSIYIWQIIQKYINILIMDETFCFSMNFENHFIVSCWKIFYYQKFCILEILN